MKSTSVGAVSEREGEIRKLVKLVNRDEVKALMARGKAGLTTFTKSTTFVNVAAYPVLKAKP